MSWDRIVVLFFFFSSRRRHTRWPRDWSSDVCSSDLTLPRWSELRMGQGEDTDVAPRDRKSTRLNSSHVAISYAVFCLKKKKQHTAQPINTKKQTKQTKNRIPPKHN